MSVVIDIRQVVTMLGLPVKSISTKVHTARIDCPVCGHKSLGIDFDKNVFNCPACGECHGTALDLWVAFTSAQDRKEAWAQIADHYKGQRITMNRGNFFPESDMKEKPLDPKIVAKRHKTYSALIKNLDLQPKHHKNLLERGLSEEDIEYYQFRSLPSSNYEGCAEKLLHLGYDLSGIPGFYIDKRHKWSIVMQKSGMLIPQKDYSGNIQGFQIRTDNPSDTENKYVSLSTNGYYMGTKAKGTAHIARKKGQSMKSVIITEGPLKGDIINAYTDTPVIAIPGVNAQRDLPDLLEQLKEKEKTNIIYVAFDMDLHSNEHVQKALSKLEKLISNAGISHIRLEWDNEYKGYDDFLTASH